MKIKCELELCIYQGHGICTLDTIEMDHTASCQSCIYITLPEHKLGEYKEKTRKALDEA